MLFYKYIKLLLFLILLIGIEACTPSVESEAKTAASLIKESVIQLKKGDYLESEKLFQKSKDIQDRYEGDSTFYHLYEMYLEE